jgi:hypothetical protein
MKHEIPYQIINKSIQVLEVQTGSIIYYLIYMPPSMQVSVHFSHNQMNLLNKPVALLGGDFIIQGHMQQMSTTSIDTATSIQWACVEETLGSNHYIKTCNIRRQNITVRYIYIQKDRKEEHNKFKQKLIKG